MNGDSKSTNERGCFLGWFVELVVRYKRFFSALAALVGYVQNSYPSSYPIAKQAGQAAVLGRLTLSVCLGLQPRRHLQ